MAEHWCGAPLFDSIEDTCEACEELKAQRKIEAARWEQREIKKNAVMHAFAEGLREKHMDALEAALRNCWVWADQDEQTALEQLCEQLKRLYAVSIG